ncbi:MAG: IS630 family transposase [Desulfobacteraceae bacterium]|nr:IS630 family transposase [Desulfobacteraceae bacterium]
MESGRASAFSNSSAFVLESPDPRSPRQTPNFKGNIKKLSDLAASNDVDIWAIDEVRFQLHGSRCRMWISQEMKDPVYYHHPTRKSIGLFGAVRLRDGKFMFHRADKFNAESFFTFVRDLRTVSSHAGRKVVLIVDNARYHHAKLHLLWREKSLNRFELNFLPPYSPELNPIERVWKLVRRMATHNRYFSGLEELRKAVESTLLLWRQPNRVLQRLCAIT